MPSTAWIFRILTIHRIQQNLAKAVLAILPGETGAGRPMMMVNNRLRGEV